jgi:hypothetical protein
LYGSHSVIARAVVFLGIEQCSNRFLRSAGEASRHLQTNSQLLEI